MGDTKTDGIVENSDALKKDKDSESLPNGTVEENVAKQDVIKNEEPEISKEENELNKKEPIIESTESEDSEKVEPTEYVRKLRSRPSRTTRSSRSSSVELKIKEGTPVSSKESGGDSKTDEVVNNTSNSDDEEFLGFDCPNTSRRDAFFKLIGKENEILEEGTSTSVTKENSIKESTPEIANEENTSSVETESGPVTAEVTPKRPHITPKSSKKPPTVNINDPKYRKPFEQGWMRELVYRSSGDSALKRSADVYYFTPNGKKLRSAKEVLSNLTEELTIENFTFVKEPIGVGDKEIVREAKAKGKNLEEGNLRKKVTPKSIKAIPSKQVKSAPTSETPSTGKGNTTPRVVFKNTSANTPKNKTPITSKPKSDVKKKKTDSSEDTEAVPDGESEWNNPEQKTNPTRDVCSIECRLAMGLIPTLQCHLCLCLYHPECVGLQEEKLKPSRAYVCKNCQVLKKQMTPQFQQPAPPAPPAKVQSPPKKDVKIISVPRTQSIVGALTTWLPHSSSIQVSSGNSNNNNNNNANGSNAVSAGSSVGGPKCSSSGGPVTTVAPSTNAGLTVASGSSIDAVPQSLLTLNGRSYVFVPKHNVVNVSNQSGGSNAGGQCMNTTGPSSSSTATVTNAFIGGGDHCVAPATGLTNLVPTAPGTFVVSTQAPPSNPHGLFLVPFPFQQASTEPAHPQATIVNHSVQAVTPFTPGAQPLANTQANGVKRVGDSPIEGSSPPPDKKTKRKEVIVQDNRLAPPSFMMNLNVGFTALLHAFQFLKVHELLRASCVSKAFEMIAHHESLWSTVRMKNSMVRDWNGFGKALRMRCTKSLDLRKMLLPETPEAIAEMWIELGKAVTNLQSLTRIDLGRCTPQAVEIVTVACPQLESLVTLAIKGSELDISYCAKCTYLTELKIKCIGGIDLKNVSELKKLKNLKHLALTTIKNLNGIEDVLPEHLESLELGECTNLPDTIATEALVKLTNLKRLRLEKGQGNCPTTLFLQAVANLPNLVQLELINFDIKPGFDIAIGQCTNLKTLLIIPTYVTQSATTNHVVMGGVSKLSQSLTYFIWGLTLELLRVTDLFIDQVEGQKNGGAGKGGVPSAKKPGAGDSIPILKPLSECSTPADAAVEEVTDLLGRESNRGDEKNTSQVDILALPKLQKVLSTLLPNTKIKILKVPFSATWRQTVTDSPSVTN